MANIIKGNEAVVALVLANLCIAFATLSAFSPENSRPILILIATGLGMMALLPLYMLMQKPRRFRIHKETEGEKTSFIIRYKGFLWWYTAKAPNGRPVSFKTLDEAKKFIQDNIVLALLNQRHNKKTVKKEIEVVFDSKTQLAELNNADNSSPTTPPTQQQNNKKYSNDGKSAVAFLQNQAKERADEQNKKTFKLSKSKTKATQKMQEQEPQTDSNDLPSRLYDTYNSISETKSKSKPKQKSAKKSNKNEEEDAQKNSNQNSEIDGQNIITTKKAQQRPAREQRYLNQRIQAEARQKMLRKEKEKDEKSDETMKSIDAENNSDETDSSGGHKVVKKLDGNKPSASNADETNSTVSETQNTDKKSVFSDGSENQSEEPNDTANVLNENGRDDFYIQEFMDIDDETYEKNNEKSNNDYTPDTDVLPI